AGVALFHKPAFQVTSAADQVVALTTGALNDGVAALTEILSWFASAGNAMFDRWTAAAVESVLVRTSLTVKLMPPGTATCACSVRTAVNIVVWPVSGKAVTRCADAKRGALTRRMKAAAHARRLISVMHSLVCAS